MKLPITTGPFAWRGPDGTGRWIPTGRPTGTLRLRNPWKIIRGTLLSARVFVGLYVNGRPTWRKAQVVDFVRSRWGHEASFISQDGLWTDRGKLKPEKSVQVILLNLDADGDPIFDTQTKFEAAVGKLARGLKASFKQKLVVVDIQANGRTVGTGLAT